MNKIEKYREILDVLNNNEEVLFSDYGIDIRDRIKSRIRLTEVEERFRIYALNKDASFDWFETGEYSCIGLFGENHNRTISWSDDDRQPKNEYLYRISFPTGAYIFGDSYPVELFKKFFEELKAFEPKYLDSANKSLYYSPNKAKAVHDAFNEILKKYYSMLKEEFEKQRVKELERELAKLKGE